MGMTMFNLCYHNLYHSRIKEYWQIENRERGRRPSYSSFENMGNEIRTQAM